MPEEIIRPDSPTTPEMVRWAFLTILGRPIEDEEGIRQHQQLFPTLRLLCEGLKDSVEFSLVFGPRGGRLLIGAEEQALLAELAIETPAPTPGWFTDVLGLRTRLSFLPGGHDWLDGAILPVPRFGAPQLHEAEEWGGTLRAAAAARPTGRFVVYELGSGWGPWVAAGARLAQGLGLQPSLLAVDTDAGHLSFTRTLFADNRLPLEKCRLLQAAVGAAEGTAWFPALADPAGDYGSVATFNVAEAERPEGMIAVPSVTIASLLEDESRVDLIHCDIQGAEADAMAASIDALNAKVCRVVIGTHARDIEERLFRLFTAANWNLEDDKACLLRPDYRPGDPYPLLADGVQVWVNRSLVA